ncbi:hypothetical protein K439DRAFT_22554 [Ramaria rubella]|nr:hypothetical protein K439DRAFT_22554 [Ramaria rubella]
MSHFTSTVNFSTYRPKGYGMSVGLQRARRQFFIRNIATGTVVASFAVGVWAYSISAVKQDVFDDVDEQAKVLNAALDDASSPSTHLAGSVLSVEEVPPQPVALSGSASNPNISRNPTGVLVALLGDRHPWLFEPLHKTIVWGAPPVDQLGLMKEKTHVRWLK